MTPVKLPIDPFLKPNLTTKLLGVGLVLTIIFILIALFSPLLQAISLIQDPTDILSNYPLQAPSSAHWFGTNVRGYDVFSRTLFGTRAALSVVFFATGLSLVIGVPLGLISGYLGGKIDRVLLFLMDTLYTLPGLLLSVALAFVLGRGIVNVAIAVSIAYIPQYFRVVRNQTASVKNELFIEAARAIGASPSRILSKYLFFNVVQSVPVLFTLNAADAILVLGGLGFLGIAPVFWGGPLIVNTILVPSVVLGTLAAWMTLAALARVTFVKLLIILARIQNY